MAVPLEIQQANERLQQQRESQGLDRQTGKPKSGVVPRVETDLPKLVETLAKQQESTPPAKKVHSGYWCISCKEPLPPDQEFLCDRCNDTAKENKRLAEESRERYLEQAEKTRIETIHEQLYKCGFTREHSVATLEQFDHETKRTVAEFMQRPELSRGLLVVGPVGTGKTQLLAAIGREYLLGKKGIAFHMARELFRRIWNTYRDGAEETEQKVITDLTTCDFLAIDDLAHEGKASEAGIGALHEILSERHGNYLPTAITTNLTLAQIGQRYGAAIASRIGSWQTVVLDGKDRRQ